MVKMDSSSDDDAKEEVVYYPTALNFTAEQNRQRTKDQQRTRGKCQLCMVGDHSTNGTSKMLKRVLDIEREHHRKMKADQMYRTMAKRYNETVLDRMRELHGEAETRRMGYRTLTTAAVRLHFEQNHCRRTDRLVWETIDYIQEALRELQNTGLWISKEGDTRKIPNVNGFKIYKNLLDAREKNLRLIGIADKPQASKAKGANVLPSQFT